MYVFWKITTASLLRCCLSSFVYSLFNKHAVEGFDETTTAKYLKISMESKECTKQTQILRTFVVISNRSRRLAFVVALSCIKCIKLLKVFTLACTPA